MHTSNVFLQLQQLLKSLGTQFTQMMFLSHMHTNHVFPQVQQLIKNLVTESFINEVSFLYSYKQCVSSGIVLDKKNLVTYFAHMRFISHMHANHVFSQVVQLIKRPCHIVSTNEIYSSHAHKPCVSSGAVVDKKPCYRVCNQLFFVYSAHLPHYCREQRKCRDTCFSICQYPP